MSMWKLFLLSVSLLFISSANAECRIDDNFGNATHFLVNGVINKPVPEVIFEIPYNEVGSGNAIASTSVQNEGGNKTQADHIRFRLRTKNSSSDDVDFLADSSASLNCINCSSSVNVPFSDFFWVEGTVEKKGTSPGVDRFSDNEQFWFTSNRGTNNIFNLRFYFDNDEILPAGTYEGTLTTRGRPQ